MDTSKMLLFPEFSTDKIFDLFVKSEEIKKTSEDLYASMDQVIIRALIVETASQYDIGIVTDVYEIFGGYVNRSFGIYTDKNGEKKEYFVRLYKKGVTEKEIQFEHALISFVKENGLAMAAGIYRTRDGKSYLKKTVGAGEAAIDRYLAVYEFLPGEDKYTWIDNALNDEEYASAAEVLAIFHNASRNFDPSGLERIEPKIMELMPALIDKFKEYAGTDWNDKFTEYYLKNLDSILEEIDSIKIPAADLAKMPLNPIHCDFHPGNLKYEDNKAVGIFDFDWSKIDLRLFDLGLGLAYCCSSWKDEQDGTLLLDQSAVFLRAYQNKLKELGGLEPLNEVEKRHLPTLLAAGNMYLIFWALRDYYGNLGRLNVFEYLTYLQHQVKLMNWIRKNRETILEMAKTI